MSAPLPPLAELLPDFIRIPSVPFLMGTPEADLSELARRYGGTRESYREESPQHTLTLPAYAIAQIPVTNALYAAYVEATGAPSPMFWRGESTPPAELHAQPVVDVSWDDAVAFCAWLTQAWAALGLPLQLAAGAALTDLKPHPVLLTPTFRLPTEAEWEHAARGTDGRQFPWGNTFAPEYARTREDGHFYTAPARSYPAGASPYGVLHMAGNVWELTSTLDALYPYRPDDGREAEATPPNGRRIARGGCYANPHGYARCATRFRFGTTVTNAFLGFRISFTLD